MQVVLDKLWKILNAHNKIYISLDNLSMNQKLRLKLRLRKMLKLNLKQLESVKIIENIRLLQKVYKNKLDVQAAQMKKQL